MPQKPEKVEPELARLMKTGQLASFSEEKLKRELAARRQLLKKEREEPALDKEEEVNPNA
jgi:hypothetical protein